MKKITFLLFVLLGFSFLAKAQSETYSKIKLDLQNVPDEVIMQLGIELDHGEIHPHKHLVNDYSATEIAKIRAAGIPFEILIEDVSAYYVNNSKTSVTEGNSANGCVETTPFYETPENFHLGSMIGFFTYQEMLDQLDSMHLLYPDIISERTPITDTLSHDGHPIYFLQISDNPDVDESEPEALYTALHHCREPASMSQLIFFMWYILENYDNNPEIKYLVDNTQMVFVPCVNPDGYLYNELTDPQGGGLWRKNRRPNANGSFGVDLNRNYGYEWGYDDFGSSPNQGSNTYRGPAPFSEPETRNIRFLCNQREFKIALNYHVYGNLLIHPWGFSDMPTAEHDIFSAIGDFLTNENNYFFGTASETVGYSVNGVTDDWMYGETGSKPAMFSYTPEVGTQGFWPPEALIEPQCRANIWQNKITAHLLLNFGQLTDLSPDVLTLNDDQLHFNLKKYGFEDGSLTVSINPLSNNISSISGPGVYNLDQLEEVSDSFTFQLDPNIGTGATLLFEYTVDNGLFVFRDTVTKIIGTPPAPVFQDQADDFNNWTNISPATWNVSTEHFYSSPSSITDSPNENYLPFSLNSVLLNEPLIIPNNIISANLLFYTRYEIENDYDFAQLLANTASGNATALCGIYTNSGTPDQDNGQPLWDGMQSDWVQEKVDLSEYAGQTIQLEFRMIADNFLEEDGFYFDDLSLIVMEVDSTVSVLNYADHDFVNVQVSPNPADQRVQISIQGIDESRFELSVLNNFGQIVHQAKIENKTSLEIDVSSWSNGLYYYQINNNSGFQNIGKFLIAH